jgi:hypothetical protein
VTQASLGRPPGRPRRLQAASRSDRRVLTLSPHPLLCSGCPFCRPRPQAW